jgi:hypothetical protein
MFYRNLILGCLLLSCLPFAARSLVLEPRQPPLGPSQEQSVQEVQSVVFRYLFARYKDRWPGIQAYDLWVGTGYEDTVHDPAPVLLQHLKGAGFPVRALRDGYWSLSKEKGPITLSFRVLVADRLDPSHVTVVASVSYNPEGGDAPPERRFEERNLLVVQRRHHQWRISEFRGTPQQEDALRKVVLRYLLTRDGDLNSLPPSRFASVVTGWKTEPQMPSPGLMEFLRSQYQFKRGLQKPSAATFYAVEIGPIAWVDPKRVIIAVVERKHDENYALTDKGLDSTVFWWLFVERKTGQWQVVEHHSHSASTE